MRYFKITKSNGYVILKERIPNGRTTVIYTDPPLVLSFGIDRYVPIYKMSNKRAIEQITEAEAFLEMI